MNSMQVSCYKHETFFYDILIPSCWPWHFDCNSTRKEITKKKGRLEKVEEIPKPAKPLLQLQ